VSPSIRFHLDENVDPAVAEALRRRGVDVTTTHDTHLLGATDAEHLGHALSQGRVIVTHDEDFLSLIAQAPEHPGIAYCHCEARTIGQIIAALMLIRDCLTAADMQNHVEFL
jgi:predicted nuclease of predicted toxin-antitoxin system